MKGSAMPSTRGSLFRSPIGLSAAGLPLAEFALAGLLTVGKKLGKGSSTS
jgi:hypothetical protein